MQLAMVLEFKCEICGGEMSPATDGVYTCDSDSRHMFTDNQGIGIWEGDEYIKRFFHPSPFEHQLRRPCEFCHGDMVNVGDSWVCNKNLTHRMNERSGFAVWRNGLQKPSPQKKPKWMNN